MNVFSSYARYYDLLYRDKDYASEASFVLGLIRRYCPDASRLLDLGCGTGAHAQHLAESGACVHGVDRSASMLDCAGIRHRTLRAEVADKLVFSQGDVRRVRLGTTFDSVISLFHVLSYQTRNDDVLGAFATAKAHLKPGGIFLFDCWYGPGVLTDRPTVRVKRLRDELINVIRIAEPTINSEDNVVDVNYTILVEDRAKGATEKLEELHRMRYFFLPELEMFAVRSDLRIIDAYAWMREDKPDMNTWNACFVAQG